MKKALLFVGAIFFLIGWANLFAYLNPSTTGVMLKGITYTLVLTGKMMIFPVLIIAVGGALALFLRRRSAR